MEQLWSGSSYMCPGVSAYEIVNRSLPENTGLCWNLRFLSTDLCCGEAGILQDTVTNNFINREPRKHRLQQSHRDVSPAQEIPSLTV